MSKSYERLLIAFSAFLDVMLESYPLLVVHFIDYLRKDGSG